MRILENVGPKKTAFLEIGPCQAIKITQTLFSIITSLDFFQLFM